MIKYDIILVAASVKILEYQLFVAVTNPYSFYIQKSCFKY